MWKVGCMGVGGVYAEGCMRSDRCLEGGCGCLYGRMCPEWFMWGAQSLL